MSRCWGDALQGGGAGPSAGQAPDLQQLTNTETHSQAATADSEIEEPIAELASAAPQTARQRIAHR